MTDETLVLPDDPRLLWQGHIALERTAEWILAWRIDCTKGELHHAALCEQASHPAGVRIAFASDARRVAGFLVPYPQTVFIELLVDGKLAGSFEIGDKDHFEFNDLPAGMKQLELWLPQFGELRLKGLLFSAGAKLEAAKDNRPKWVVYGSSITRSRGACYPTKTWPGVVAIGANWNHWNLGYAGQCHLDPIVSRMIRGMQADYLTMKVGINIYMGPTLSIRTFRPAIIGSVLTIRETHPDTPFALVSPIYSAGKEETPNAVGLTLRQMREEVEAAVAALRSSGDRHLHYVDGLELLGPDEGHLLADGTHPTTKGYPIIGQRFLEKVVPVLTTPVA
jgi:hypothetical protein